MTASKPRRSALPQIVIGLVVGGLALILALWGVPLTEIGEALTALELPWLLPVAGVFLVQQTLRALRQMVILRARHPEHRFRTSLAVLCIGFFFVNTLPARLGEVVRPMLLAERESIPLGAGFAMVVVERAVDLVAMGVMVSVLAWLVPAPEALTEIAPGIDLVAFGRSMVGVGVPVVVLALLTLLFVGQRAVDLVARLTTGWSSGRVGAIRRTALSFARHFVEGVEAVRQPGRLASILILTATAWGITGFCYTSLAYGLGIEDYVNYSAGMGLLGVTMLGMALPAAPGFAGTYEAAVRAGLALYGVVGSSPATPGGPTLNAIAVAYALVMHWWMNLVQSATAIYFLVVDRVRPLEVVRRVFAGLDSPDTTAADPNVSP